MRQALFLVGWMLAGATVLAADEIEPLEGDFLEYLANLEGDDDNWTLLVETEKPTGSTTKDHRKAAEPSKPSKEAAKPAVEDR